MDPVCGMMVDEKKTKLQSTYQGKNYYFCSSVCKTTFDKAPQNTQASSSHSARAGQFI